MDTSANYGKANFHSQLPAASHSFQARSECSAILARADFAQAARRPRPSFLLILARVREPHRNDEGCLAVPDRAELAAQRGQPGPRRVGWWRADAVGAAEPSRPHGGDPGEQRTEGRFAGHPEVLHR